MCTDARVQQGDFADFVDSAFAGGVDIIQLRDKTLEAAALLDALAVLREVAARHGRAWAVNDRADIARLAGSPVLHVGQRDLGPVQARSVAGPNVTVGLSTHSADQIDAAAADPLVSYFCVGPVWRTPTKPGREAVGLDLVRYASRQAASKPWFAIGGINLETVGDVVDAGAKRIVVVRAITEASDPADAARKLRKILPPLD